MNCSLDRSALQEAQEITDVINANLKICIDILDAIKGVSDRIGRRLGALPPVEVENDNAKITLPQPPDNTTAMVKLIRYELDTIYHLLDVFSERIG